ncbi:MAG: type II toxin-antitoxin system VapC family toxin [Gammaproteobacteria bacterium]|nr:type II toxin-antitoxin system VapC family toxin [Gammaproteobacteria bacterium]MBU1441282.1 type II toxin-antitoxin system VapC family toxin [Gammaproteobacteria bacterium]MBU2285355.1 type II toxin-antitoxin system VapC family toxin [Gammaproteobacteria bacterium]MBU2410172.1 type II toxin-antitoxin system VapC family toxin [Gammaproteobacteria bacterium]
MPLFMLDTDTASYLLKGTHPGLDRRIAQCQPTEICVSAITRGELLFGLRRKRDAAPRLAKLIESFLGSVRCVAWDDAAADAFGIVAASLEQGGTPIGAMDTMIACHAMALDATLITNNTRHFARVAGLRIENWALGH